MNEATPSWRDAFRNRLPLARALPPRLRFALMAGLGTAIAIGTMELLASGIHTPLALIPFVTSIVLVLCLPAAEPAQPRALIGGHLVASLAGYAVQFALPDTPLALALAVGLSATAMHLTRTMHPPAGIDPLLIVHQQLGFDYLVSIILPGALLLAGFSLFWRRLPGAKPH